MQHKIVKPSRLLDKHGELIQKGYALHPILKYNRADVAKKSRLKEWDYYLIYNTDYGVALTVANTTNFLMISTTFIDFHKKTEKTRSLIRIISKKKFRMPKSSTISSIVYQDKSISLSFRHIDQARHLKLRMKNFDGGSDFDASFVLMDEPKDSMVIATPFDEDKKAFYYNRKIIGMRASGTVIYKNKLYSFSPINSFGLLDWGRGVWPYKTTWYWGAAQGTIWGNVFGFNLGYGFGNTSAATENMIFFNGKATKLRDVKFQIPKNDKNKYDYMKPWKITSSDSRLDLTFTPIIDRSIHLSVLVLSTQQHQVFGKYNGSAILDDGTIIYLHDFLGFAERVVNRW